MRQQAFDIHNIGQFRNNPQLLIQHYQPVIRKAIRYFSYTGYLDENFADDISQEISIGILERHQAILDQYRSGASFTTYMNSVIFNMCKQMIRLKKYRKTESLQAYHLQSLSYQPANQNLIRDEMQKLSLLLDMFCRKKGKLILTLKMIFKLPVTSEEIISWFPDIYTAEVDALLQINHPANTKTTEKEVYVLLVSLYNRLEKKNNTGDSLRKWISLKLDEMIDFMNAPPGNSKYDKETLQYLIENCFMKNTP